MDKIKAIYFENNPTHYQAKFLANILWRMQWNEKKKGYEIILSPDEALTMSGRKHAPDDMDIEKFCYNMLSPALVVEYEENNKDDKTISEIDLIIDYEGMQITLKRRNTNRICRKC